MSIFSPCPYTVGGDKGALWGSFYKGTNLVQQGSILWTWSSPKCPTSKDHCTGQWFSMYRFWRYIDFSLWPIAWLNKGTIFTSRFQPPRLIASLWACSLNPSTSVYPHCHSLIFSASSKWSSFSLHPFSMLQSDWVFVCLFEMQILSPYLIMQWYPLLLGISCRLITAYRP